MKKVKFPWECGLPLSIIRLVRSNPSVSTTYRTIARGMKTALVKRGGVHDQESGESGAGGYRSRRSGRISAWPVEQRWASSAGRAGKRRGPGRYEQSP